MSQHRVITLDLETQKGFHEVDRKKIYQLKVSVVGIHDSLQDRYLTFEENELLRLEEVLKQADLIVGFNVKDFDLRVLAPYLLNPITHIPVLDLMEEIANARGHRVSLQSVATATLKVSKSGSGFDAINLFREGKMEELKKYCLDDVRITKGIYDYGRENGNIFFLSSKDYQTHEVKVDWSDQKWLSMNKKEESFPTSLF